MNIDGQVALLAGGASGLGLACARRLAAGGAQVVILDLPSEHAVEAVRSVEGEATFVPGDVTDPDAVAAAVGEAESRGNLRVLVHTAGIGGPLRIVDKAGEPGDLDRFRTVLEVNVVGTFNVLRQAAAAMARTEPVGGERAVCVLTSSIAAWDARIGQVHYGASKGAIASMALPAARDLANKLIRVCAIAPGTFDTPLLGNLPEATRDELAATIPHPRRLGDPVEFASLALEIVRNPMLNGETIRLDGALRMSPR